MFSGQVPQRYSLQVALTVDDVPADPNRMVGTVESSPSGILCTGTGTNCEEDYLENTSVRLAAPAAKRF